MTGRSLFKNTASLTLGRILLSVGRLGATLMVARMAGVETYGAYALVLGLVFLCEWLADFGQTDIVVRDTGQGSGVGTLAALVRLKLVIAPAAAAALPLLVFVLGYDPDMVRAGLVGMLAVAASALIQPFRARLRLDGRQYFDIAAEIAGFVLMIALLAMALWAEQGLWALIGAFSAGRMLQLLILWLDGGRPILESVGSQVAAFSLARTALPLGIMGLLVLVYELSAPILLSGRLGLTEVGLFLAAFRLVAPTLIVAQSVTQAFFPVLSAAWPGKPDVLLAGQNSVILLCALSSALMAAAAFGGAGALMRLFGAEFSAAETVLRIFSAIVFLRALSAAMAPLIIVANRQTTALWLTATAVALQLVLLVVLVPRFGLTGAAVGYLVVETVVSTLGVWMFAVRVSGIRPDWTVPVRLALALAGAAALTVMLGIGGTWQGFFAAPVLLLILSAAFGVLTPNRGRAVIGVLVQRASVQ